MNPKVLVTPVRIGLLALAALLFTAACASLSGYDPSRYVDPPDAAPDPDTAPLPPERRSRMLDPRSFHATDASAGVKAVSPSAAP